MLETSVTATTVDEGVRLALSVRNSGPRPIRLDFPTGQRAEFTARRVHSADTAGTAPTDEPVLWRYGADKLFIQAFGSETIDGGESTTFEATWANPPTGEYRVAGEVVASGVAVDTVDNGAVPTDGNEVDIDTRPVPPVACTRVVVR